MPATREKNAAPFRSGHRPPPEYTQRGVTLRLFACLAAIMLVAAVIETRAWKWRAEGLPGPAKDEPVDFRPNEAGSLAASDLARSQIDDDTVVFRPAESEIWFHELGRVHNANSDSLRRESIGRVAYSQLYNQPHDYRGKLVTVSGTIRLAYRVAAPQNDWGVKELSVFVLQPASAPDSPILVYALEAPIGFPRLGASSADPAGKMREDAEITGIFFKRCVYAGQGGTYTAPLLIAKSPTWHPTTSANPPAELSASTLELTGVALAALLLAICITAVLWKRTSHRHHRSADRQKSASPVDLGPLTLGPSTAENLRELEREAGRDGNV